jgi:hypothetical protein
MWEDSQARQGDGASTPQAIAVLAGVHPDQCDLDLGEDPYCSGGQLSLHLDLRHSTTLPHATVQEVTQLFLAEAMVLSQPSFQPAQLFGSYRRIAVGSSLIADRVRFLQDVTRKSHVSHPDCCHA